MRLDVAKRRTPDPRERRTRLVSRPSPYGDGWESVRLSIDLDPVEHMAARGWISVPQKQAADRFRAAYEAVTGSRGMGLDYSQERVDTSGSGQAVSQQALDGMSVLRSAVLVLGKLDYSIVSAIAGEGQTVERFASRLGGDAPSLARKECGRRFRLALTVLAVEWGFEREASVRAALRAWSEGLGWDGPVVDVSAWVHPGSRPRNRS